MKQKFLELAKPRITFMVGLTTLSGSWVASRNSVNYELFFWTVIGTMLVASATGCLNQLMEIKEDSLMERTRRRPLPQGIIGTRAALAFGIGCALIGSYFLAWRANIISCLLAIFTLLTYLLVYTPLKKKTSLATWIGAIPGAMPPLIGWTAVTGRLDAEALALYGIQFLWQIPHFLALSWIYREDYAKAGFRISANLDSNGSSTVWQIAFSLLLLFPVSLVPYLVGLSGTRYLLGSVAIGLLFLYSGIRTANDLSEKNARQLFLSSLIYLPCVFSLIIVG